jgi:hypothetical protein
MTTRTPNQHTNIVASVGGDLVTKHRPYVRMSTYAIPSVCIQLCVFSPLTPSHTPASRPSHALAHPATFSQVSNNLLRALDVLQPTRDALCLSLSPMICTSWGWTSLCFPGHLSAFFRSWCPARAQLWVRKATGDPIEAFPHQNCTGGLRCWSTRLCTRWFSYACTSKLDQTSGVATGCALLPVRGGCPAKYLPVCT